MKTTSIMTGNLLSAARNGALAIGFMVSVTPTSATELYITKDVGASATEVKGINNNGQMVGWYAYKLGDIAHTHGFLLDGQGNLTGIDVTLPGVLGTIAYGINDHSEIVGRYWDGLGGHGFVARSKPGGSFTFSTIDVPANLLQRQCDRFEFGYMPFVDNTEALGINNNGDIVGRVYAHCQGPGISFDDSPQIRPAFLLSGGVFTTFPIIHSNGHESVPITEAFGISNQRFIVGEDGTTATLLTNATNRLDLYQSYDFSLPSGGATASGINESGVSIVGSYRSGVGGGFGGVETGFLTSSASVIDFATTRDTTMDPLGFTPINVPAASSTAPSGVNDNLAIVGSYLDSNGIDHGFLRVLLPVLQHATFASTGSDINNSYTAGLIDNVGLFTALSSQINAAQEAAGPSRINLLFGFVNLVNAAGVHIKPLAATTLVQDAAWLINPGN